MKTDLHHTLAKAARAETIEHAIGRAAKLYLDASAAKLSPEVSARLTAGRRAALVAMNSRSAAETVQLGGGTLARTPDSADTIGSPTFWGASVLVALALALYAGAQWDQDRRASEAAEADMEILAGDVPMDAYFDKGFKSWVVQGK